MLALFEVLPCATPGGASACSGVLRRRTGADPDATHAPSAAGAVAVIGLSVAVALALAACAAVFCGERAAACKADSSQHVVVLVDGCYEPLLEPRSGVVCV